MSRTVNILVVILAILFVFIIGIVHIVGIIDGMSEAPAEWKDFFILGGKRYYNSYNIIDASFAGRVLGSIEYKIPRSADASTYRAREGEAVYLDVGTKIYSVTGFEASSFAAVIDDGDCYLYSAEDASTEDVVAKCGLKTLRRSVRFLSFSVGTVCDENSEYGVRISVIKKPSEMQDYLSRYVNDFRRENGSYSYDTLLDDRIYDEKYFAESVLFAIRLPEDDGQKLYDLGSITTDEMKMTFVLKQTTLPEEVFVDGNYVRHLFVEVARDDYTDQKISYQIERYRLSPDGDFLKTDDADPAFAESEKDPAARQIGVRVFENAASALGTEYEALVTAAYDREFFDENVLAVIRVNDETHGFDHTCSDVEFAGGVMKVAIDRTPRLDETDERCDFFTLVLPRSDWHGEVILPILGEPIPRDSFPKRKLRDVLIVRDAAALEELAGVYGFETSLYDEDFFDSHVLLFAGGAVCFDGISLSFVSVDPNDHGVQITVKETVPVECDFSPTYKYVAVPFLRSDVGDGELTAKLIAAVEKTPKNAGGILDRFFDD